MSRRDMMRRVLLITGSVPMTAFMLTTLGCGTASQEQARATTAPTTAATAATTPAATATRAATPAVAATPGVSPTDPTIEVANVKLPGPASDILAYYAKPKAAGTYPGILIIHENRGLVEPAMDIARRYAKEGFAALAIDLASRAGGTGTDAAAVTGFLGRANPDDLVADLLAGVKYLKAQPATQGKALGVTGFCFGGGYCFEVAAASPDVKAAVPYYGSATRPLEALAKTQVAVLAIYGGADTRITAQAPDVEKRLQASGRPYQIKIYDGAAHAFFNDLGTSYHPEAAADAWKLTLAWFRQQLA
jgi:carboxymethylenebutenolidase